MTCVVGALALACVAGCADDSNEPDPVLEPADIEEALITIDDLPDGYRPVEPGPDADEDPPSECALDPSAEPVAEADVEFEDSPGLSLVQHSVSIYEGSGATEYLDEVRDVFATCDSADVRVEERDVDDTGDDIAAYRMTLVGSDLPLTTDVTYFRSGDVVVSMATLSVIGPPSAALDKALLEAAVDRLELAIEA